MVNRRPITRTLAAAAGALLACPTLPIALAYADDDPFADFTTAVGAGGNSAATSVASSLDSTLSKADPSLAATLDADVAAYEATGTVTSTAGVTTAPGIDNAFGDLLGSNATAIAEANALDDILYSDLAAAGQTSTIASLDTEASTLTSVVAPVNESPYTLFAAAVGNPDPNAAVLDANMDPGLAATFAGYVEDPSTIPTSALSITGVPAADDGFAALLPAGASAAEVTEATELDNLLYADYAPLAAEAAFYAPAVDSSAVPLTGDDPFSDFATTVGSTDTASEVAYLDATLISDDQPLAAVLNGYVDGTLSPPSGLLTAPTGDDPFTDLLPSGASSADITEAEDLDNALYTGLTDANDSSLASTLASDAANPINTATPAADPFTEFATAVSADVTPPGVANLDADFANADPSLAGTFAGYVLDPSSIPTTDPTAPAADDPFADLLSTATSATSAQMTEATDLDNVLYADDSNLADTLGGYASYLTAPATTVTPPGIMPPPGPIALLEQDFSTTIDNAHTVFSASHEALSTLLSGDTAAIPGNLLTALEAVTLIGAPDVVTSAVIDQTLGGVSEATPGGLLFDGAAVPIEGVHTQVYDGLIGQGFSVPGGLEGDVIAALDNFAASPLSGVLIGAVGPFISPEVELFDSLQTAVTDFTSGDPTAALTQLIDTPINVVDAFFNGATLNLDALVPFLEPFVSAGDGGGESITSLDIAFGGLFSPGSVVDGVGGVENGVGGSLLNSLGMELTFHAPDDDAGGTVTILGEPVGPIAAVDGLLHTLGDVFNGSLLFDTGTSTAADIAGSTAADMAGSAAGDMAGNLAADVISGLIP